MNESADQTQVTASPDEPMRAAPDRDLIDTTAEYQSVVMSAKLDVKRAEAVYNKSGTKADFNRLRFAREEVLRLYGLKAKFSTKDAYGNPIPQAPTIADIRAKKSFIELKKGLMKKFGDVGPENEILIENIMSMIERQEIMRLDPDVDTKELMSIDLRISSNIEHLRKSLPTKDAAAERGLHERTVAILEIVEGEMRNDPVKLRRILESMADAGYITAPGGKVGRTAKRAR